MKHFIYTFLGVLVLLASVGGYWFMHQNIAIGIGEIAAARSEAEAASGRERFARAASSFLADTSKEREELDAYVVQDEDLVAAIETIEAAAAREKVTASVGSVEVKTNAHQFHEVITMTISARGQFGPVTAFAGALETLPFVSRVLALSFEEAAERTWFLNATVEFIKQKPQQ